MNTANEESLTFEAMLIEVENSVRDITSQNMSLDEMIRRVEKGYDLLATMRLRLNEAREKVELLKNQYSTTTDHP